MFWHLDIVWSIWSDYLQFLLETTFFHQALLTDAQNLFTEEDPKPGEVTTKLTFFSGIESSTNFVFLHDRYIRSWILLEQLVLKSYGRHKERFFLNYKDKN
jgi:hypothetical protein